MSNKTKRMLERKAKLARMDLDEKEKAILRKSVQAINQAQEEVKRRRDHLDAALMTIVELKGLDTTKFQLSFDYPKDIWALVEVSSGPTPPDLTPEQMAAAVASNGKPQFPPAPGDEA